MITEIQALLFYIYKFTEDSLHILVELRINSDYSPEFLTFND